MDYILLKLYSHQTKSKLKYFDICYNNLKRNNQILLICSYII